MAKWLSPLTFNHRGFSKHALNSSLGCFWLLSLASTSSQALDLVEAYQRAIQYDATFQASTAEYQAAIEAESQSTAALLPNINLSVFTQTSDTEVSNATGTFMNSQSEADTDGYSLTLKQTIYNQQLFDLMEANDAVASQALATFEAAKQDLIIRLAKAYFNVLDAQDNLAFALAETKTHERLLEQNRERFRVGMLAITDVKEAQAKYDTTVAQEIIAENNLSNTREALWVIINSENNRLDTLKDQIPLVTPEPVDINAWKNNALANNLNLRAAQYAAEAAQETYSSSRAGHYPTLDLTAERSNNSLDGTTLGLGSGTRDREDTTIMLKLNVPIYSGGFTSSKTRQSAAQLDRAKALLERQQRLTVQQSRTAFLGVQAAISEVKARKQALISTETAVEATEAGYRAGTRTIVDVLQIQSELFRSRRDYARSRYDYILNVLELKQSAGSLSINDIKQINDWLVHYAPSVSDSPPME